jgi:hypothetical protein
MPSLIDGHPAKGDRRVGSETPPRIDNGGEALATSMHYHHQCLNVGSRVVVICTKQINWCHPLPGELGAI